MKDNIGLKFFALLLPVITSIFVVILMMHGSPIRSVKDLTNRLLASFFSSVVFGVVVLMWMSSTDFFTIANDTGAYLWDNKDVGLFVLQGCVFAVCALPGWWIVSAVGKWLNTNSQDLVNRALNKVTKHEDK